MDSHASSSFGSDVKQLISWKLPGLGMSNMNFLIAYVIQFVSNTMITFSQYIGTKSKFKQFSEFGSRINKEQLTLRLLLPTALSKEVGWVHY